MTTLTPFPENCWQCVTPHRCSLGESPFWHPDEQMLYWLDISGQQILRANIYMGSVETWDMPSEPGCMAPAARGGLVIALRHGVFRATEWRGQLQLVTTLDYDPTHMRANDGKCDTQGRFWVGTIDETRQLKNAALYSIDARHQDPSVQPKVACQISPTSGMTTANGLAFSPDNHTAYWADTPSHTVWAWNFDADSGRLSDQTVFAKFATKPPGWQSPALAAATTPDTTLAQPKVAAYGGRPDGAAVDVQGNYWVAMFEGQRVCQLAPDGTLLASIPTPLMCPTMPCLGGEDLKTLYITSASHHRSAEELAAYPLSGGVLSMRVDVPGLPVQFFQDGVA
ncbi:MAG TPA: SMP-30/gluconolactonase/LRE family protein [Rhodoferax sp.]